MTGRSKREITVATEHWPIAGSFKISRGAKTEANVVVANIVEGGISGRGECVPYTRYGETTDTVIATINARSPAIAEGIDRTALMQAMPAGAARNALDCALIDLEAKTTGRTVSAILNIPDPRPVLTAFTISLDTPDVMATAAARAANRPLLKIKLGGPGDIERIAAVRVAAPEARLVVDANEAWSPENFVSLMNACAEAGVELIEQPLPADRDDALLQLQRRVPVCADESVHGLESLDAIVGKYDAVNIKLDKTGGLTEAARMVHQAQRRGLAVMVGCMVATSLSMAPAMYIAGLADYVDLDGPLLLARDRKPGLVYDASVIQPPNRDLWG